MRVTLQTLQNIPELGLELGHWQNQSLVEGSNVGFNFLQSKTIDEGVVFLRLGTTSLTTKDFAIREGFARCISRGLGRCGNRLVGGMRVNISFLDIGIDHCSRRLGRGCRGDWLSRGHGLGDMGLSYWLLWLGVRLGWLGWRLLRLCLLLIRLLYMRRLLLLCLCLCLCLLRRGVLRLLLWRLLLNMRRIRLAWIWLLLGHLRRNILSIGLLPFGRGGTCLSSHWGGSGTPWWQLILFQCGLMPLLQCLHLLLLLMTSMNCLPHRSTDRTAHIFTPMIMAQHIST
mmetsp:Transcript_13758/g.29209  ORF Transcript_13758/g.29209 Transcript_13758/m.29209 type:complete len:285 (+) Transcript_13758:3164-4018(+)